MAYAALGRGHSPQKRRVVVVVDPQPKPAAQVLDLGPVEKARSARHLVRNLRFAQRFLKRLGLVVGPVQNGKVPKLLVLRPAMGEAAGAQALDPGHGALGLVFLAVGVHNPHRLAFAQVTPQVLGKQLGVGANHVVGRPQNGASRPVVLLQLDDLERGEIHGQLAQVVQRGTTPAVNGLVIITHRREAGATRLVAAHQQFQDLVLRGVGVLVFIHQHMAHLLLPALAHRLMVAQQFQGQGDQVVKVHALVGAEALLVVAHHAGNDAFVVILGQQSGLLGVQPLAFPAADDPLPRTSRGHVHRAASIFQDAGDVVGVENRKIRFQAQYLAVLAQHAHAQGVKGADHHVPGRAANQALRPLTHFSGGLVGERDGGNAFGFQPRLDQATNLVRDHTGFARAGTGQHQTGSVHEVDGFLLGQVEAVGGG